VSDLALFLVEVMWVAVIRAETSNALHQIIDGLPN